MGAPTKTQTGSGPMDLVLHTCACPYIKQQILLVHRTSPSARGVREKTERDRLNGIAKRIQMMAVERDLD